MLVLGRNAEVRALVEDRTGAAHLPADAAAFGVGDEDGTLRGGILFHDWTGSNVEITAALDRPLRRGEIKGLRHYAFDQLGARRVTFRTASGNEAAWRFLLRHATPEAVLPAWFPDADAVQFVIMADDPRWLRFKVEV